MVGTIYENTLGMCVDSLVWHITQEITRNVQKTNHVSKKTIRVSAEKMRERMDCLPKAIQILKSDGWKIEDYAILDNGDLEINLIF